MVQLVDIMNFVIIGCVIVATLLLSYLLFCPPKILVLYKADWCPHCKAFIPEWEKIQRQTRTRTVDSTDPNSDVERYPTIRLYRGSYYKEYNGPRNADSIMAWYYKN